MGLKVIHSKVPSSGFSIVKTIKTAFSKAWEKTPQPVGPLKMRRRSTSRESRVSTRTRVASLEKIEQTGSIKIKKRVADNKPGYTVESRSGSRSESRSGSKPGSRAGSRDRWESSS